MAELVHYFFVCLGVLETIGKEHNLTDLQLKSLELILLLVVVSVPIAFVQVSKSKSRKTMKIVSAGMHNVMNDIRNHYFQLSDRTDPDLALMACGQCVVDHVSDILNRLSRGKPRVSIKVISNPSTSPQSPKTSLATSLCWDRDKREARQDDGEQVSLSKSTPLWELSEHNNAFYAKNWIAPLGWNKALYESPYVRWYKDYKSAMVVPIRIKTAYLPPDERGDGEYTVAGFLWCDWKNRFPLPLREKHREHCVNILLCVADGFFHYLQKIRSSSPTS